MHLPLTVKEIQAGYLSSLYFKDIYIFNLAHNRLPSKKTTIKSGITSRKVYNVGFLVV